MMNTLAKTLAPLALLLAAQTAAAQVGEKKFLTLDGAKKAAAAAEADARRRNLPVVIAVVDDAGELLFLERIDAPRRARSRSASARRARPRSSSGRRSSSRTRSRTGAS